MPAAAGAPSERRRAGNSRPKPGCTHGGPAPGAKRNLSNSDQIPPKVIAAFDTQQTSSLSSLLDEELAPEAVKQAALGVQKGAGLDGA